MFNILLSYNLIDYDKIIFDKKLDKGNLIVYKGTYNNTDIAIKEYIVEEEEYFDYNLINELYIGTKINSERLMKILGYSINNDKSKVYLLMEYINSSSLWNLINDEKYSVNIQYEYRLSDNKLVNSFIYDNKKGDIWNYIMKDDFKQSIVISLLKAIKSMYNNKIIHGDLKTPNLAINIKDEDKYIKIIDYGTCYYNMDNIYIEDVIGTEGYYAPEQENKLLNHKSDIYSVGVIIIEIYVRNIWYSGDIINEIRNSKQTTGDNMESQNNFKESAHLLLYNEAGNSYLRLIDQMTDELFERQCEIYDKKYSQNNSNNSLNTSTQLEFNFDS